MLTGAATGLTLGSLDVGSVPIDRQSFGNVIWGVNGNIGSIRIRGMTSNLDLLAGAKIGTDGDLVFAHPLEARLPLFVGGRGRLCVAIRRIRHQREPGRK